MCSTLIMFFLKIFPYLLKTCPASNLLFQQKCVLTIPLYKLFYNAAMKGFLYITPKSACEGWDSNPRTPARLDPKSNAFDRTGRPSHLEEYRPDEVAPIYLWRLWIYYRIYYYMKKICKNHERCLCPGIEI